MSNHTHDSLPLLSPEYKSAKNVLEFSLLLPEIYPFETQPEDWIDNAISQCYSVCHPRLMFGSSYDFFGLYTKATDDPCNLYQMCNCKKSPGNPVDYILKADFFANTILNQCIMSTYDVIMQSILPKTVTPYAVANKLGTSGYNQLKQTAILTETFSLKNTPIPQGNDCSSYAINATAFQKKIMSHEQALENSQFNHLLAKGNHHIPSFQSDLVYRLMLIDARQFKNLLQLFNHTTENKSKKNWENFKALYNSLTENLPANHTDRLYYLYRMERSFPIGLADCISQNINKLKNSGKKYPDGVNDFNRLAAINRLPNVFSRYIYLQFAFDAMSSTQNIHDNYFTKLFSSEVVMRYIDPPKPFSLHGWQDVFEKFCRFFSDFIFPAFEWYFLLLLVVTVDHHSETQNSTAQKKLLLLQQLLTDYIEEHHETIENPFHGKRDSLSPLLSNYDGEHIIRPAYLTHDIGIENLTYSNSIAEILTALKSSDTYGNQPLPVFDKTFCYNPAPDNHAYNKFIGQFISKITNP